MIDPAITCPHCRSEIKLTESLVQLGLTHSKVAFPSPSTIIDDRFLSLAGASG